MDRPTLTVADIFRRYGDTYRREADHVLSTAQRRVMTAIAACRTAALGGHVEQCDHCGHTRVWYNSCRNRHCPCCQSLARAAWIEDRTADLLDCEYVHVVFTVPQAIAEIARQAEGISLTGVEDLGSSRRPDELGQFARAFNGLVTRLRSALRTHRQFMADASHELRTPVAVVRSAVDVALSQPHRSEAEYREALSIAGDQSRRLARLVDGMLVLARADAGGYPLRPVELYLDEIIVECRRAVGVLAAGRDIAIETDTLPETRFTGDEDLLRQLVLNLMQNAVQDTPPGTMVSVTIADDRGGSVQIRVADNGPGIAPADQARIFDRFVQLDSARHGSGAGLGLPIARWIADAHGGTLVLESTGSRGSTFCATLRAMKHQGHG